MTLEASTADTSVMCGMKEANRVIQKLDNQMKVDGLEDLVDCMAEERHDEINDRAEFFKEAAKEDEDELVDELNELMAMDCEAEM